MLVRTGISKSCINPPPSWARVCFFVLKGTLNSTRLTRASMCFFKLRFTSLETGMFPWRILKRIWTNACICSGVAVSRRNWRWCSGQQVKKWRKGILFFTTRDMVVKWVKDGQTPVFYIFFQGIPLKFTTKVESRLGLDPIQLFCVSWTGVNHETAPFLFCRFSCKVFRMLHSFFSPKICKCHVLTFLLLTLSFFQLLLHVVFPQLLLPML